MKNQCLLIGNAYSGHVEDIINKLKDKDHENEILKRDHQLELMSEKQKEYVNNKKKRLNMRPKNRAGFFIQVSQKKNLFFHKKSNLIMYFYEFNIHRTNEY